MEEFAPPEDMPPANASPGPNGSAKSPPTPPLASPQPAQSPWGGPAPRNISDDELAALGVNIK